MSKLDTSILTLKSQLWDLQFMGINSDSKANELKRRIGELEISNQYISDPQKDYNNLPYKGELLSYKERIQSRRLRKIKGKKADGSYDLEPWKSMRFVIPNPNPDQEKLKMIYTKAKFKDTPLQKYVDYLGETKWNYFATMTTPYTLSQRSARRMAERYFNLLTHTANPDYTRSDTYDNYFEDDRGGMFQKMENPYLEKMFYVTEHFECKDGCHLHALLKAPESINPHSLDMFSTYRDAWQMVSNSGVYTPKNKSGIEVVKSWEECKVEPEQKYARIQLKKFLPHLGAEGYCGKYILKSKGDFDLLSC